MGIADFLLSSEGLSPEQGLVDFGMKRYFALRSLEHASAALTDKFLGDDLGDLQKENLKLDIESKRRRMKLPMHDDDYDGGLAGVPKNVLASSVQHALQKLEGPKTSSALMPYYKTATVVDNPQGSGAFFKAIKGVLHDVGRVPKSEPASVIARIIGKR